MNSNPSTRSCAVQQIKTAIRLALIRMSLIKPTLRDCWDYMMQGRHGR